MFTRVGGSAAHTETELWPGSTTRLDDVTALHDTTVRGFASDNYAGVHPEVLAAIAAANGGHQVAYGEDVYTARLQEVFAAHFGDGVEAFPVFNGTGANVVGLQSMLPRWGAVVARVDRAHQHRRERRARAGRRPQAAHRADRRTASSPPSSSTARPGAGATSTAPSRSPCRITQTTELGTLYTRRRGPRHRRPRARASA